MLASGAGTGIGIGAGVIGAILIMGLVFMGMFRKAEKPVWAAFVPIVNLYYILKIAGRPGWWLILYLIPCVDVIITLIVYYDLSKSFGHGLLFWVALWFPVTSIFAFLWLSYSGDRYIGAAGGDYGAISRPSPPPIPSAE